MTEDREEYKTKNKNNTYGAVYLIYSPDDSVEIKHIEDSTHMFFEIFSHIPGPEFSISDLTPEQIEEATKLFKRVCKSANNTLRDMKAGRSVFTERVEFRLSSDEALDLDELTEIEGLSRSELIRYWIREKYSEYEPVHKEIK